MAETGKLSPLDTIYIRQQSDFGATRVVSGQTYFNLVPARYVLLKPLSLTIGFAPAILTDIIITSDNPEFVTLTWTDGTITNPVILWTSPGTLKLENIHFIDTSGTAQRLVSTGISGSLVMNNCQVEDFTNVVFQTLSSSLSMKDNKLLNVTGSAIFSNETPDIDIHRNFLDLTGTTSGINIQGVGVVKADINFNKINNPSAPAVQVAGSIDPSSNVKVVHNRPSDPTNLFSVAGVNETSLRVSAFYNNGAKDSTIRLRMAVNNNTPLAQTIVAINTPVELTGFTFTLDSGTERFQVSNSNSGQPNNVVTVTYLGSQAATIPIVFMVDTAATGSDDVGIGIIKNGTPVTSSFIGRQQPAMGSQPRFQTVHYIMNVVLGDTIKFGVENQTSITDITITNPTVAIGPTIVT